MIAPRKRTAWVLIAGLIGIVLVSPASAQPHPESWSELTRGALQARPAHPKLASAIDDSTSGQAGQAPRDRRGRVLVSISGNDRAGLQAAIERVGGDVQLVAPDSALAAVDPSMLPTLSDDAAVTHVDAPRRLRPDLTSEGVDDYRVSAPARVGSTSANSWHVANRTGAGTSVAIVDVGFAGLLQEQIAGALPPDPLITKINHCGNGLTGFDGSGPSGNLAPTHHGTAVAEIVHQMAPDAALTLICVFQSSDVTLAEGDINAADIPIVNMSLGDSLGGRGDGTGPPGSMASAVALGRQHGELWTVSAGNAAQRHLKFTGRDVDGDDAVEMFPGSGTTPGADASELTSFSLSPNTTADVGLKWDAWPTTRQQFDLCLWQDTVSSGTFQGCWSNNQSAISRPPTDRLLHTNTTASTHQYWLAVFAAGNPVSNRLDMYYEGQEHSIGAFTVSGSLTEPATSPAVLTAGAHCFANASIEPFSAAGPTIDGRIKPELTGPDGVSNNRFGPANNCALTSGFFGTSAAAPHAAGAAALVKGQFPGLTNDQIKNFLVARAVQVGPQGDPNQTGAGKLDLGSLLSLPQHDPIGSVDSVTRAPTGATLQGWSIDPDTSASISVNVFDNGVARGTFPASSSRPDVGAAFPDYSSSHGYNLTIAVAAGAHTLCVTGVNAPGSRGADRTLRCESILVSGAPFGSLDSITRAPGGLRLSGWSIDPDTASPILVDSYVDASGVRVLANRSRPDVANVFPGYGPQHGFSAVVPTGPGQHIACSYGINAAGTGGNMQLGCRSFDVSSQPLGSLDSVVRVPSGYQVSGWSLDPDAAGTIQVHVYLDGSGTALLANTSRPDVGAVFPDWGPNHGYNATIFGGTAPGAHTLCAFGINVASGTNTQLGCVNFAVSGNPFGSADSIVLSGGAVTASGWAIDPDTSSPIQVHVYVDGAGVASIANGNRPDVGAVFPAYGAAHGYSVATNFPFGTHTVCAYAINAGPGGNVQLGCRTLSR